MRTQDRAALVGNRWVLVGGVVYLLEWVAIIWAGLAGVGTQVQRGAAAEDILSTYASNEDAVYAMAGWFAVVLLGRVLLFIGLRQVLVDSWRPHPLLDLAVVASAVSVTLEIASYGLAASAATYADTADATFAVAIDQAGAGLNLMIGGGLGVAIVCTTWGMWRSGLFAWPLNALGAVSGIAIIGAQLTVAPALGPVFDVLYFFPLVFWIWMLWAGGVCWHHTPDRVPTRPMTEGVVRGG